MKKKRLNAIWLFIYGVAMITLGALLSVKGKAFIIPAARVGGIFVFFNGVCRLIKQNVRKSKWGLISCAIGMLIGVFILLAPFISLALLTVFLSLYLLLNGAIKLIDFINSVKNGSRDFWGDFTAFLFYLVFAILMLIGAFKSTLWLSSVVGIYCVLFGITELKDFMRETLPDKAKNLFRRRFRFSIPLAISTFSPLRVLREYRRKLDSREIDIKSLIDEEKVFDDNKKADIHVLIHVSLDGVGMVGHCDIAYKNKVMSYGNYDALSGRLFGALGDGVMFLSDKKRYVDYSVENDNQMIFDFGLSLTDKQIKRVRRQMARIKKSVYRWRCPFEKDVYEGKNTTLSDYTDYCSRLWHGTKAKFYKFRKGKFKTYCVMSTNCVLLADSILSKAGTDIINTSGIISPGAYYDYLQKEYRLNNGIVVSRDIYSKYNKNKSPL